MKTLKIYFMLLKTSMLLLLSFYYSVAVAQPLTSQQIDELANRSMKAFNVPGMAIAVIKNGKIIHEKGYGIRSLATKEKVDENTLFGIASNTKAFTVAALGILMDEGKLKWDDKVRDYIPEFKLYNPYVTEEFTIRDLLTHRSGLGLGAGDLMLFPYSVDFTTKDLIYNLRFLKQSSSFRTRFDYDNNLYIVAGEIVSRISGKSWDEFIEDRILKPLGMIHSAAAFDRIKNQANVIDGHGMVEGELKVIDRHKSKIDHPAGSIYSSIADLCKWVQLQLANGKYGAGAKTQLFSEKAHEEMWTPQTIIRSGDPGPYNNHFVAYGLGFFIFDANGYKVISHTGGLEGMVTQITMIPELNLGIIVLTNQQETSAFLSVTNQILDGYFNKKSTDRVKEYSGGSEQVYTEAKKYTDSIWNEIAVIQNNFKNDFNRFTGTYEDPWLGKVEISVKNGKLWFHSKRSPKLSGEMFPYKASSFVVKWRDRSLNADAFVNFILDVDGKATGFQMKPLSPLTDFSYDFQDLDFHRTQ